MLMTLPSSGPSSEDARWRAVTQRERASDGRFVYAVVTTGVFCRPSCGSRLPLRANVQFFGSPAAAAAAGYRACKRCRPTGEADPNVALLERACARLAEEDRVPNELIARDLALSVFGFQRFFKRALGITPQQYRRRALAERAKRSLTTSASVTDSVYDAGYSSSSRFYEGAGRELGMSPSSARTGAEGQHVLFAIRRSTLGPLLVAWTDRGVADVRFGTDRAELRTALRTRFPRARLEARARGPAWLDTIVSAVERPCAIDVPLDLQGTAFQERVWRALRAIPVGETRSYEELAKALGSPSSARAVARACATNTIAVVVPCHRVVRKNGDLAGYRWGTERKRELLRRESRK